MANLVQAESTQDETNLPVPVGARMGPFSLTMAWWAVCSAIFYIVVGASLAMSYGAKNAIIGMALSVVTYGIINNIISRYAIKEGLSVALFSRRLFGRIGASLATLIFFSTAIYYAVFEGSVIAVAINATFPWLDYHWAALFVVIYSVLLVFGSVQTWLDKFNGVLLPFYILGLIATVVASINVYGYQADWINLGAENATPQGWWNCFTYYMGVWILMLFTFDYARFGKQEDSNYHARVNFGMPFYLLTFLINGIVSIYLVASIPQDAALSEVSVVLSILKLLGIWGLLFVWITQTRINTANFYLASVNMQSFFSELLNIKAVKFFWSCIVGGIVYLLMLVDVFSYLLQALAYQGVFVVAWVGIALAHILVNNSEEANSLIESDNRFNKVGLSAWLISTIVGIVMMNSGASIASFSAPITFVVSFFVYAGIKNSEGKELSRV
ncbi:allantoin permease [Neptunomonas phycophila]|uniref:purine-cytosine permease family protein n=1 Tax=Neptunomonas phycophila TaxID=1572645 RepID=UPI0026E3282F|nr:allantoin permease [Neptunomonas phycophila]MDO6467459.1 allantoin permease [Neptunomonas phycophila]